MHGRQWECERRPLTEPLRADTQTTARGVHGHASEKTVTRADSYQRRLRTGRASAYQKQKERGKRSHRVLKKEGAGQYTRAPL